MRSKDGSAFASAGPRDSPRPRRSGPQKSRPHSSHRRLIRPFQPMDFPRPCGTARSRGNGNHPATHSPRSRRMVIAAKRRKPFLLIQVSARATVWVRTYALLSGARKGGTRTVKHPAIAVSTMGLTNSNGGRFPTSRVRVRLRRETEGERKGADPSRGDQRSFASRGYRGAREPYLTLQPYGFVCFTETICPARYC